MKKRLPSFLATCLAVLLLSTACSKANPDPITGDPGNIVKQGTWKISLYNDKGAVKTSLFSGYTFSFGTNGTITASGPTTASGTWSSFTDSGKQKMVLNFGAISNFSELNEDWVVITQTTSSISLQNVSGGGGGTSLLTFEKN